MNSSNLEKINIDYRSDCWLDTSFKELSEKVLVIICQLLVIPWWYKCYFSYLDLLLHCNRAMLLHVIYRMCSDSYLQSFASLLISTDICTSLEQNTLRLYNPHGNTTITGGMLQECYSGYWYAVCDNGFDCSTEGGYGGSNLSQWE